MACRMASTLRCTISSVPKGPSSAVAWRGSPATPAALALALSGARGVQRQHQRGVGGAGVAADLRVAQAALAQPGVVRGLRGQVVRGDEVGARVDLLALPIPVQAIGHRLQCGLIVAAVAEDHDVGEAVLRQRLRRTCDHRLERRLGHADRAGVAHVLAGRCDAAFGHVGHHRRHQRIAQFGGDAPGQRLRAKVVLAQRHVRAVLLDPADRDDDGALPLAQCRAYVVAAQFLQMDAGRQQRGVTRRPGFQTIVQLLLPVLVLVEPGRAPARRAM